MKKYLGLFIVLSMIVFLGAKIVQAEDGGQKGSPVSGIRTETSDDRNESASEKEDSESEDSEVGKDQSKNNSGVLETEREKIKEQAESIREEAKQKMEVLREKIKEEKDAIKAKIKNERIDGRQKALDRFDNAVERINSLKDRVNTMIDNLAIKNVDTTNAKNSVQKVEALLIDIKAKIAGANTILVTSIDQLTTEQKTNLRTLNQDIQKLVKDAHASLVEAVKSLKDSLKIKLEENKSSTDTEKTTQ